jgi:GDP-L-fucose synthase
MRDSLFDIRGKRVWVAGETGLVGRTLLGVLSTHDVEILSAPHNVLDLTNQQDTLDWLVQSKPDIIFMAAARVGGIGANAAYPADFIRDNLSISLNVIDGAHRAGVGRLVYLGSSCIYPRDSKNPISEDCLLTGALEQTNEAYAIAKIAGLKLCQHYRAQYARNYVSVMPTNLYGPYDRFDENASHVIPAMMLKLRKAKGRGDACVELWGTGRPLREFLYADDLAHALITIAERYDDASPVNIGSGQEISIRDLAHLMAEVTGFSGDIVFDETMPDGTPRKLLDSKKISALGWKPKTDLKEGLLKTYEWFLIHAKTQKVANNGTIS